MHLGKQVLPYTTRPTSAPTGGPCTVKEAGLGIYIALLYTKRPPQIKCPETFLEVLGEWGCTLMWEDMQLTGDDGWLETTIRENTLEAVTDSSYM